MNEAEKERLIKKDIVSIENRVRHAFNQGYEMGMKENKEQSGDEELDFVPEHKKIPCTLIIGKPCGDAISRQAVLDGLASIAKAKAKSDAQKSLMGRVMFFTEQLPPVTPQQRTGRWIKQNYGWNWRCSECGFVTPPSAKEIFTFCPKCGCKMREVEDAD